MKKNWKSWRNLRFPFFIEFTNILNSNKQCQLLEKQSDVNGKQPDYNNYYQEIIARIEHVVKDIPR